MNCGNLRHGESNQGQLEKTGNTGKIEQSEKRNPNRRHVTYSEFKSLFCEPEQLIN